jgi:hypothetical protein
MGVADLRPTNTPRPIGTMRHCISAVLSARGGLAPCPSLGARNSGCPEQMKRTKELASAVEGNLTHGTALIYFALVSLYFRRRETSETRFEMLWSAFSVEALWLMSSRSSCRDDYQQRPSASRPPRETSRLGEEHITASHFVGSCSPASPVGT